MPLRIAMIGTGFFAAKHSAILAAHEDVKLTAFCGTSMEKAGRMARQFEGAKGYDNVTDMLDSGTLDAVYICVPPMAHEALETAIIERKLPFFVEKPLASDFELPSKIAKQVEDRKLLTSVGYHFRYHDSVEHAKEALTGRTAGMAMGYWMGDMPGVYWWRNLRLSGGQFVEQTTHIVDLLRYLLGEAVEVYAAFGRQVMQEKAEGVSVPDVGSVTLKMASGAIATIANTCLLPEGYLNGLHLYTDQGVMEITQESLRLVQPGELLEYRNRANPYERETDAFLHALRTGDASGIRSDYADALKTQRITAAATVSAQTGQPVKL